MLQAPYAYWQYRSVPAVAARAGAGLYPIGHVAFLDREWSYPFRRRALGAVVLLLLIPAATRIPALGALALVTGVCTLVVACEAIHHRPSRVQLLHPDLAA